MIPSVCVRSSVFALALARGGLAVCSTRSYPRFAGGGGYSGTIGGVRDLVEKVEGN